MIEQLAVPAAVLVLVVGLIVVVVILARRHEREKIRRWLAEEGQKRGEAAAEAHDAAAEAGRKRWL